MRDEKSDTGIGNDENGGIGRELNEFGNDSLEDIDVPLNER